MKSFVYCAGYRCGIKHECLRNRKHIDLIDQGIDTSGLHYIASTVCVKHRHKNYLPVEVYDKRSSQ
jgi:hypothetical protein